jgi:uncharacterized alpha-E superfamily protein
MLSRVADAIYWIFRYIERAENIARFVDVNFNLILDMPGARQQWEPLVITTGDYELFYERYGDASQENVIQFLAFDTKYPHSIASCLQFARENARSVREIISSEMWEQLNDFYWLVKSADPSQVNLPAFFQSIKQNSHLFAGITNATFSHGEGWHFGRMGRYLERADKTARILDVKYYILLPMPSDVGSLLDEVQWMSLLKSASAYEMYRKQGQHRITPAGVAEFLILDREFPRSIHFCVSHLAESMYAITGSPIGAWSNPAERTLGKLRAKLDFITEAEIFQQGLHEFLDTLQLDLNVVDDEMFHHFFSLEALPA